MQALAQYFKLKWWPWYSMIYSGRPQLPLAYTETDTVGIFWGNHWLHHYSLFSPHPGSFILIRRPSPCLCLTGCLAATQTCQACFSLRTFALTVPFACNTFLSYLTFLPCVTLVLAQTLPYQRGCLWLTVLNINLTLPDLFSITLPCLSFPHSVYHRLTCIYLSVILLPPPGYLTPWEWLSGFIHGYLPTSVTLHAINTF